jgi:hypothetical protein
MVMVVLFISLSFLSNCSQVANKPINNSNNLSNPALSNTTVVEKPIQDSWIRIVPGRIIHFSPTSNNGKFKSYYIRDIETEVVRKEFQKPNYRLGLLSFNQKNQIENTEIMNIFGDYSYDGKVLSQVMDNKLTFTVNHADESGAKINMIDINHYNQSRTIRLQDNTGYAQFIPSCSYLDDSTGSHDMIFRSNGTHDKSTYLMQNVNEKDCRILGTLSLSDDSKPDPKLGPSYSTIDYGRPFVLWTHTTPSKEHYLFGNLTKNFGGKEVLKRYEHSPTNVEEEWVIEGGINKSYPFMAKFSSDWNMEWAKRWTLPKDNLSIEEIVPVQDGYVLSGILPNRQGLWIGKINQSGEFEYLKTHLYADNQAFYSSKLVLDKAGNSYIVGKVTSIEWTNRINGRYQDANTKGEYAFLASFDPNGNVRYAKKQGDILYNNWDNVLPSPDGSLFLAGILFNTYILAKTDTQGNLPLLGNFSESIQFVSDDISVNFPTQNMKIHINPVTGRFDPIKTTVLPHELVKTQSNTPIQNITKVTADGWLTPDLVPFPDLSDLL